MKYLVIIFALLYAFLLMSFRLSDLPGLHGDEAWLGLYASKILGEGFNSLHGLNTYTGSLYSLVISLVFKFGEISIFNLRILGVVFNLIGLAVLAFSVNKFLGRSALLVLFLIVFSSTYFFLYSRIAWEICAFQFFLISIKVSILLKLIVKKEISFIDSSIFFLASLTGIFNHFIFISESLAFLSSVVFVSLIAFSRSAMSKVLTQALHLALINIVLAAIIFITKPRIEDVFFQVNSLAISLAFLSLPLIGSIAFISTKRDRYAFALTGFSNQLSIIFKRLSQFLKRVNLKLVFATTIGLVMLRVAAFFLLHIRATPPEKSLFVTYKHLWGFLGTVSSILPIERTLIYKLNFFQLAIFQICWLVLLAVFLFALILKLSKNHTATQPNYDTLIFYFCPIFSLLELSLFIQFISDRYYMITGYLLIAASPIIWNEIKGTFRLGRRAFLYAIAFLIGLNFWVSQSVLYNTAMSRSEREPFSVSYIAYRDTSKHFLDNKSLFNFLKENKICNIVYTSYFIAKPIQFYQLGESYSCNENTSAQISYCPNCQEPVKNYHIKIRSQVASLKRDNQ